MRRSPRVRVSHACRTRGDSKHSATEPRRRLGCARCGPRHTSSLDNHGESPLDSDGKHLQTSRQVPRVPAAVRVCQVAPSSAPPNPADLRELPLFGYVSSRFPYRFARPAAAFGVSRADLSVGLASSELLKWGGLGVFGQEARYCTMCGLLNPLTLVCSSR